MSSRKKSGKKKTARRKAVAGKAARGKPGVKRRKSSKKKGPGWIGRIWRLMLLAVGGFLGLLLPWVGYLNHQVTHEFEGRKWDLPSRVYARALEVYPGLPLSAEDLELELTVAGYRKSGSASRPGLYRVSGSTFEINRRPFRFPDGAEAALRFAVEIGAGEVKAMRETGSRHWTWFGWSRPRLHPSTPCRKKTAAW